jgi:hypothetical protein
MYQGCERIFANLPPSENAILDAYGEDEFWVGIGDDGEVVAIVAPNADLYTLRADGSTARVRTRKDGTVESMTVWRDGKPVPPPRRDGPKAA